MSKVKPDEWRYEEDTWVYGQPNDGVGVYPFCLEWVANVVCGGEIKHLSGFKSEAEAKSEALKFYQKLKQEQIELDTLFI